MPIYTYHCPVHDDFDHTVWGVKVVGIPESMPCPHFSIKRDGKPCPYTKCRRMLTLPAAVIVEGGTGARRGG